MLPAINKQYLGMRKPITKNMAVFQVICMNFSLPGLLYYLCRRKEEPGCYRNSPGLHMKVEERAQYKELGAAELTGRADCSFVFYRLDFPTVPCGTILLFLTDLQNTCSFFEARSFSYHRASKGACGVHST